MSVNARVAGIESPPITHVVIGIVAEIRSRRSGHLQVVVSRAHPDTGLNYTILCCWCAPDKTLGLQENRLGTDK